MYSWSSMFAVAKPVFIFVIANMVFLCLGHSQPSISAKKPNLTLCAKLASRRLFYVRTCWLHLVCITVLAPRVDKFRSRTPRSQLCCSELRPSFRLPMETALFALW